MIHRQTELYLKIIKKLFWICCLIHVGLVCYGQTPVIQSGVYTSFWGFKNNKPLPDVKVTIMPEMKQDSLSALYCH